MRHVWRRPMLRIESHVPQVRHGEGSPPSPPAEAQAAKQPAPTADPMEIQEPVEEATLEDQILEQDGRAKFLKGGEDA